MPAASPKSQRQVHRWRLCYVSELRVNSIYSNTNRKTLQQAQLLQLQQAQLVVAQLQRANSLQSCLADIAAAAVPPPSQPLPPAILTSSPMSLLPSGCEKSALDPPDSLPSPQLPPAVVSLMSLQPPSLPRQFAIFTSCLGSLPLQGRFPHPAGAPIF